MCIICNCDETGDEFLAEYKKAKGHMNKAIKLMKKCSEVAEFKEQRDQYDATHKEMKRILKKWNKIEHMREAKCSHVAGGDVVIFGESETLYLRFDSIHFKLDKGKVIYTLMKHGKDMYSGECPWIHSDDDPPIRLHGFTADYKGIKFDAVDVKISDEKKTVTIDLVHKHKSELKMARVFDRTKQSEILLSELTGSMEAHLSDD